MKKKMIVLFFAMAVLMVSPGQKAHAFWGELLEAVVETLEEAPREFDERYGDGAMRTLTRGTDAMTSIEPNRQRIIVLYEQDKITRSDRDRRLNTLVSAYDDYKAGRMSQAKFERVAESLTTP